MREYSSKFALENNKTCSHTGPILSARYGSALKIEDKKVRTCMVYIANNPVERRLCTRAEDYRWNFEAYAVSDHPFSTRYVRRKSRVQMVRSVIAVKDQYAKGKPLSYKLLSRLFERLEDAEKEQLTDVIISMYSVIEHDQVRRFFKNHQSMIESAHNNTGSEYEIRESFVGRSDAHYASMRRLIMRRVDMEDVHDVLRLDHCQRDRIFEYAVSKTGIPPKQARKYLRMSDK